MLPAGTHTVTIKDDEGPGVINFAGRKSTESTPPTRASKPRRRGDWRPAFLAAFKQTAVVSYACEQADVDRSTVYKERQRNDDEDMRPVVFHVVPTFTSHLATAGVPGPAV